MYFCMYSFIYIQLSLLKCKFHEDIELVSIVWHCIAYCSGIHHVHSNNNCGVNKRMNLHVIIFQCLPLSWSLPLLLTSSTSTLPCGPIKHGTPGTLTHLLHEHVTLFVSVILQQLLPLNMTLFNPTPLKTYSAQGSA